MSSADLQISEMLTKNLPNKKSILKVNFGTSNANCKESGVKMTPYEKLYELNLRLSTARYRLEKAEKRVKALEAQIEALLADPRSDESSHPYLQKGWDVT
jgi:hypothetical protein